MQSSLLDRIWAPSNPLLPQHDRPTPQFHIAMDVPSVGRPSELRSTRSASFSAEMSSHPDPFLPIDRASKSLQRTIQSILDAQSEGLLAGLTFNDIQQDVSSTSSPVLLPSESSSARNRQPVTIPVRQPPKKQLSLPSARRALSRAMRDFSALKLNEEIIVDGQIQQRVEALDRAEAMTTKQEHLQSEINSISSEPSAQSAKHLRTEADDLDLQIRNMEEKLSEMKTRHRLLADQARQMESSVQSKLSSYHASLEMLEREIRQFLTRPPITHTSGQSVAASTNEPTTTSTFHALTPRRRTLQMARESWKSECDALRSRKSFIAKDAAALEAGGRVWREVAAEIQSSEQQLKSQMEKLSMQLIPQDERERDTAQALDMMKRMIDGLEQRLQEAEQKDWKLLVCCIGAELEAFKEGRRILLEASGHVDEDNQIDDQPPADSPDEAFLRQPHLGGDDDDDDDNPDPDPKPRVPPMTSTELSPPRPPESAEFPPSSTDQSPSSTIIHTSSSKDMVTAAGTTAIHASSHCESEEGEGEGEAEAEEDDDPGPDFLISHT